MMTSLSSRTTIPSILSLRTATVVATLSAAVVAAHGQVSLEYIGRVGFTDPRHTRADGFQSSVVLGITPTGYTIGESERFFGTPDPQAGALPDRSAWMGSPNGGTKSIGFYDATHTSSTGYHTSAIVQATQSGRVIGHSIRYAGEAVERGQTAWIASWGGGTRRIGLFYDESPPPLSDGSVENHVIAVNEAGQSIGYAMKDRGQEAWLADALGNTRRIGIYDPAHMAPNFEPHNTPVAINSSGTAIGYTTAGENQWAWVQRKNGGPVVQIGLYDAAHTSADGVVINYPVAMNERGYVIGSVRRGEPASPGSPTFAFEPWLWTPDGGTISLDTGNYTGGSAYFVTNSGLVGGSERAINMFSYARAWVYDTRTGMRHIVGLSQEESGPPDRILALTEDGIVVGASSPNRQNLCWMARLSEPGVPTRLIGFYQDEYYWGPSRFSFVVAVADNGLTIGTSDVNAVGGVAAWLANPVDSSTTRIGLLDGTYTGPTINGFPLQTSEPTHVTRSGFVAGYSLRYHWDSTTEGQTAWIYNSAADRYAKFVFSVRPSDGYAFSQVTRLLESGVALGTYTKFAEDGTDLGDRAFVWITRRGAFDIGERLDVDPESVDWDYLASALEANEQGHIAGHGVPFDSTGQGVFLVRIQD